jgi:hypothetical protein
MSVTPDSPSGGIVGLDLDNHHFLSPCFPRQGLERNAKNRGSARRGVSRKQDALFGGLGDEAIDKVSAHSQALYALAVGALLREHLPNTTLAG